MKKFLTFLVATVMGFFTAFAQETTFTVMVHSNHGANVEGAQVTFEGNEYTSDENGNCVIEIADAAEMEGKQLPITAYKDGYQFYEGTAYMMQAPYSMEIVLEPEEINIIFKVVNNDYEPIEGATISIGDKAYGTDDKGEVVLGGLEAPDYLFKTISYEANYEHYETYQGEYFVEMTGDNTIAVILQPKKIIVTAQIWTGPNNTPVSNALVTFMGKEYLSDEYGNVVTSELLAPEVWGEKYIMTVYKDAYEPEERD